LALPLLLPEQGALNERRAALVQQAFARFDRTGDGVVDLVRAVVSSCCRLLLLSGGSWGVC